MKQHVPRLALALLALLAVALAGCGGGTPKADWQIKVSGAVSKPLTVSFDELVKMPQTELKDVLMQKSRGEDETHSFSGVALSTLLEKAGVQGTPATVTVLAADGYAVEIGRDELEGGMIALKQDGKWIAVTDKAHGPLRLVTPHTPANRWVFQLTEIQIK